MTSRRRSSRPLATLVLVAAVVVGGLVLARHDGRIGSTVAVELDVGCPNHIHFSDGDDRWWAGDDPEIDGPLRTAIQRANDRLAPGTITFGQDGSVTFHADAGGTVRLDPDPYEFHDLACAIDVTDP